MKSVSAVFYLASALLLASCIGTSKPKDSGREWSHPSPDEVISRSYNHGKSSIDTAAEHRIYDPYNVHVAKDVNDRAQSEAADEQVYGQDNGYSAGQYGGSQSSYGKSSYGSSHPSSQNSGSRASGDDENSY